MAAEEVETLQEQMKHMTACHLSNWRKDVLDQVTLTLLKPQADVKTPHYTSNFLFRLLL